MKSARYLHFSTFCLDRVGEQLWQGAQLFPLRRKPFALLRYLVEHAREVVTKDALLTALWPGVHVSEEVLTVHMRAVRVRCWVMTPIRHGLLRLCMGEGIASSRK